MRIKHYPWYGLMVLLLMGTGIGQVKAANNGDLVQGVKDSKVYYIEGNLKRWVADRDAFDAWGFNPNAIRRISTAELNNQPTGPKMTRLINYAGSVYYVTGGQRKWVPSFDVLAYYSIDLSQMTLLNTDTFNRLSDGGQLSAPVAIRIANDNKVFLLDGGKRRPFASDDVMSGWGISRDSAPINAKLKSLPVGPTVTRVVNYNGNVYWVGNSHRYWLPTEEALLYNNLKWSDMTSIGDAAAAAVPEIGQLRPPAVISTPGDSRIWLTDDGGAKRWIPSLDILYALGYNLSSVQTVPNSVAYHFGEGSNITRFIRDSLGNYYYLINGQRRKFDGSPAMRRILGLADSDIRDLGWLATSHIIQGPDMTAGIDTLEGHTIPTTSGAVGIEQHLYITQAEYDAGRTGAVALHYANSGTPSESQNGMAGGWGAFGSASSHASANQEKYYINMRWNYCNWSTNPNYDANDSQCLSFTGESKSWYQHKKVVVVNPANNRELIASVEEAGPAFWTGKVSGLSPEAFHEIGATQGGTLNYLWAVDQTTNLGRIQ